jgi:hypothetical protein
MIRSANRSGIRSSARSAIGPSFWPSIVLSPFAQALTVLRSFGADGHAYLPGIGAFNGADAGNYLDAGFAATAVDSPVGLVMDANNTTFGAERFSSPDNVSAAIWTKYDVNVVPSDGYYAVIPNTANAIHRISQGITRGPGDAVRVKVSLKFAGVRYVYINFSGWNSAGATIDLQSGSVLVKPTCSLISKVLDAEGYWTLELAAIASNTTGFSSVFLQANNTFVTVDGTYASNGTDAFIVKFCGNTSRVGAIPAINTTTAQKPILRQTDGRYSWEFTPPMNLQLAGVPFQMADDHVIVSAFSVPSLTSAAFRQISGAGNTTLSLPNVRLRITSTGFIQGFWRDDAGTSRSIQALATLAANTPYVATCRQQGVSKTLRVEGQQQGVANTAALSTATFNSYSLGANQYGADVLEGTMHGSFVIKGAPSDEQVLTIERGLAYLQGRSI